MRYDERKALLKEIGHAQNGDDYTITVELHDAPEVVDDTGQPTWFVPESATLLYSREYDPVAGAWGYLTRIELLRTTGGNPALQKASYTSADRHRLTPPWAVALLWEYCPMWYDPTADSMPPLNTRQRRLEAVTRLHLVEQPAQALRVLHAVPEGRCGMENGGTAVCRRFAAHEGKHYDTAQDVEW